MIRNLYKADLWEQPSTYFTINGIRGKLGRWPFWPFHSRLCLWNKALLITVGAWISAGVTLKVGSSQWADRGNSRQCLSFCETCQRVLWRLQRGVFCINDMAILPLTKGLFKMQSWTSQTQSKLQQSEAEHFKSSFSILLWMFNSLTHPTTQIDWELLSLLKRCPFAPGISAAQRKYFQLNKNVSMFLKRQKRVKSHSLGKRLQSQRVRSKTRITESKECGTF